jgi:hypothetical protein
MSQSEFNSTIPSQINSNNNSNNNSQSSSHSNSRSNSRTNSRPTSSKSLKSTNSSENASQSSSHTHSRTQSRTSSRPSSHHSTIERSTSNQSLSRPSSKPSISKPTSITSLHSDNEKKSNEENEILTQTLQININSKPYEYEYESAYTSRSISPYQWRSPFAKKPKHIRLLLFRHRTLFAISTSHLAALRIQRWYRSIPHEKRIAQQHELHLHNELTKWEYWKNEYSWKSRIIQPLCSQYYLQTHLYHTQMGTRILTYDYKCWCIRKIQRCWRNRRHLRIAMFNV